MSTGTFVRLPWQPISYIQAMCSDVVAAAHSIACRMNNGAGQVHMRYRQYTRSQVFPKGARQITEIVNSHKYCIADQRTDVENRRQRM